MNAKMKKTTGARVRVKQIKSGVGGTDRQRQTLRGLGFRKLYQTVELEDSPSVRGMITAIAHLVRVEE